MLNYKVDFDNRQAVHKELIIFNVVTLRALAWRGYQLKSRGVVVVHRLNESQASLLESIDARLYYLSKKKAVQIYPEAIELFQLMDEYNPNNEMIVSFIDIENSIICSYCLSMDFPLLNCFILQQERLLSG